MLQAFERFPLYRAIQREMKYFKSKNIESGQPTFFFEMGTVILFHKLLTYVQSRGEVPLVF